MRGGCCRGLVAPGLHGRGSLGRRVGRCCKDRERPVWLPSPHRVRDRGGLGDVTAAAVALAVAAITSPVADDDIDGLKIRPSMVSLAYPFWVAALVIYTYILLYVKTATSRVYVIEQYAIVIAPFWFLDACRMVLRFVVFQRAAGSFALGRNVQLVSGHMADLQQTGCFGAEWQLPAAVPCLIVTGERNRDVEESPTGYRVKPSALEDERKTLIKLDRVWSESGHLLTPELKDLCLSFALFKCLRRRFARHQLAEGGSSWRSVSSLATGCSARKATTRDSSG
ncbi:LOW QUALITY PROTEIN: hypothetical protein SETIT_8G227800v2 [Setaria italica]|uniref:DUF4220 domain-containing protein n=1 Tax=Setaria italica TaxID=4555 RepID=A0A368SAM1_SETIT|nr:LOW QUALITY PROTEIN: hypothetical protein SETIT_8G227800v2 [Setaria italica]